VISSIGGQSAKGAPNPQNASSVLHIFQQGLEAGMGEALEGTTPTPPRRVREKIPVVIPQACRNDLLGLRCRTE
jgi:hypothetical protein